MGLPMSGMQPPEGINTVDADPACELLAWLGLAASYAERGSCRLKEWASLSDLGL